MTVESVTAIDKRRYKVTLEEGLVFALYGGEIRRYRIEEGGILTEETYREILEEVLCRRARERVLYLLKSADKTERQLRQKLEQGFYPEEAADRAIAFAKQHHYVDDESFARRYVENQASGKSRRRIEYDLMKKGIGREKIRELLAESPVDEAFQIRKFLEKKRYDPEETTREEKQKLAASLARRGYSYEVVSRVLGEAWESP